jgi:nicotinamidase/pyrazinamidase
VADTHGAAFAANLDLPLDAEIITKADTRERDAYSAFEGTDFDRRLKSSGVRRLIAGGLATDYCVLNSVRDALALGYEVILLTDAVRAVEAAAGDGERALDEMRRLGAQFAVAAELRQ